MAFDNPAWSAKVAGDARVQRPAQAVVQCRRASPTRIYRPDSVQFCQDGAAMTDTHRPARIVDTRVRLWGPARTDWYPCLFSYQAQLGMGDVSAIRRFDVADYRAETGDSVAASPFRGIRPTGAQQGALLAPDAREVFASNAERIHRC